MRRVGAPPARSCTMMDDAAPSRNDTREKMSRFPSLRKIGDTSRKDSSFAEAAVIAAGVPPDPLTRINRADASSPKAMVSSGPHAAPQGLTKAFNGQITVGGPPPTGTFRSSFAAQKPIQ